MALSEQAKSFVTNKFPAYAGNLDSLSSIPGFDSELQRGYEIFRDGLSLKQGNFINGGLSIMNNTLSGASSDPVAFVKSAMRDSVYNGKTDLLKSEAQYLAKNNVPVDDIKSIATGYARQKAEGDAAYAAAQQGGGGGGFLGNLLSGNIGGAFAALDPTQGDVKRAVDEIGKALSTDDAKKALAVGAAFFVPGVGSAIGQSLVSSGVITGAAIPYASAIGTAIASTASQTAQGVPFEQALGNATTNAVVSTGAPGVAQDINALVKSPAVADAITSAGASAFKTAAAGGTADDIQRNMTAALAGSSASSLYTEAAQAETAATGRVIGSAVGGAVAGGAAGAATGVAGELGRPETTPARPPQLAEADTGIVSDVPSLTEVLVTAKPETPDIGETSIVSPDVSIPPKDKAVMDAAGIGAAPSLKEVTVTATKETPPIEETSIIEPEFISAEPPKKADEETKAEEEKQAEKDGYRPDLFIYGGKAPKTSGRQTTQLGTTLQAPFYPSTTLGQALTGYRGAGEIEGKKTGKPRRDVWNEESLRLKDALGL